MTKRNIPGLIGIAALAAEGLAAISPQPRPLCDICGQKLSIVIRKGTRLMCPECARKEA